MLQSFRNIQEGKSNRNSGIFRGRFAVSKRRSQVQANDFTVDMLGHLLLPRSFFAGCFAGCLLGKDVSSESLIALPLSIDSRNARGINTTGAKFSEAFSNEGYPSPKSKML
jgi:hypothetical protein